MALGVLAAVVAVGLTTLDPLPAEGDRGRHLARRRLPAGRAARRVVLGRLARRSRRRVASALAFNFFHIPPTGRFTIAEGENWVALAVFLVAAIVASELAERARQRGARGRRAPPRGRPRRRDGAHCCCAATTCARALPAAAQRLAASLELAVGGDRAAAGRGRRAAARVPAARGRAPARDAARAQRTLPEPTLRARCRSGSSRRSRRCWPRRSSATSCSTDVVETRALRRTDVLKTALLRAVSHDLRSPLTAIIDRRRAARRRARSTTRSARELAAGDRAGGRSGSRA